MSMVAVNLGDAAWWTPHGVARWQSPQGAWGVVDTFTGRALSSSGENPSVWSTKAVAEQIAAAPPEWDTIPVVLSARVRARFGVPAAEVRHLPALCREVTS